MRDPAEDAESPHYQPTIKRAPLIVYAALGLGAIVVICGVTYELVLAPRW